ncbi:hypothetical protein N481_05315 [Pseudoalteromonas luteoviolacea S4047-1]|uniref:Uncharacterized protein n=1 Tax=Pseudoalteromonas luteoviolacea S4054 TaxID=1129367 RepID=A0A0F6AD50_9GAMM|nr:hypothetical protein N479_11775 [Pseudoalteromonas luteoviolacea S4054]KZN77477.1 hypothetical protein N481_05315 [Pseudoalteromonas luteoviolacea S4047-1]
MKRFANKTRKKLSHEIEELKAQNASLFNALLGDSATVHNGIPNIYMQG